MKRGPAAAIGHHLSLATGRPGLIAALGAVALAVALAGLLTAVAATRSRPSLATGVYYGWTDGHTGLFQVLGDACPAAPGAHAAVVAAYLTRGTTLVELRPPAVATAAEPLVFGEAVPVLSFAPRALGALVGGGSERGTEQGYAETALTRLMVGCRSHAAAGARLGSAALALVPSTGAAVNAAGGVGVTARRVPPASGLLGVLVLSNDSGEPLVVRALRYAPRGAATGIVLAAAGERSMVAAWLGAVFGAPAAHSLVGTLDPTVLTPWDAAYQAPAEPGALRERSADDLDLRLLPGDMALIAIDQRALARTLVPRPALLYPVLGHAADDDGPVTWSGVTTPLYGSTLAWR